MNDSLTIAITSGMAAIFVLAIYFLVRNVNRTTGMFAEMFRESYHEMRYRRQEGGQDSERILLRLQDQLESVWSVQSRLREETTSQQREYAARMEALVNSVQKLSSSLSTRQSLPQVPKLPPNDQYASSTIDVYRRISSEYSHSIKTPLASISLAIAKLDELYRRDGGAIHQGAEAVAPVYSSLLENARVSIDYIQKILERGAGFIPGPAEKFTIAELVRKALRLTREVYGLDINVDADVKAVPEIEFYWTNLLVTFVQVLENSFEACDSGGKITIRGKQDNKSHLVTVLISNTGSLIANENREKLFQTDFTTKGTGRGRGLSIARRCIEAVGGSIKLEFSDKRGTQFSITFLPSDRLIEKD